MQEWGSRISVPKRTWLIGRGTLRAYAWWFLTLAAACTGSRVRYVPLEAAPSPLPDVLATLYLVGDAGEANPERNAVLAHLTANIEVVAGRRPDAPIVVAYLGDNIYDLGARQEHRDEDFALLAAQADVVASASNARAVFLPGNHDWAKDADDEEGRAAIELQLAWIAELSETRSVSFLPSDACPGPSTVDLPGSLHLIAIDTEWLIRSPEDDCGGADAFYDRLRAELEARRGARVVVLAHHPMASGGPHGGNIGLFEKGPFAYYIAVKMGLGVQHMAAGPYMEMRERLRAVFTESGVEPLVFAAGHDHTLQVIRMAEAGEPRYQLVSGSAAKTRAVTSIDGTRYASDGHGYMRLEFHSNGARLVVFALGADGRPVRAVFSCTLTQEAPIDECPEAPPAG